MERYETDRVQRCREKDIVEVARDLGLKLKRQGSTLMTQCLWHEDTRPSMQVGGRHNTVHCYSCGETHGVIDLVMKVRGCSFKEAVEWLTGDSPYTPDSRPYTPTPSTARGKGSGFDSLDETSRSDIHSSARPRGCIYFNPMYVRDMVTGNDSLTKCLRQLFDAAAVSKVALDYQIGCWTDRRYVDNTLFPIIDSRGRIHNLKLQHYDTDIKSQQFAHCDKKHTFWLGAILQREGKLGDGCFDNDVLFGEHLLAKRPSDVVGLVESPKNAIVAALALPQLVWVATGNKGMLKRQVLEPLRGRDVLVYPDEDAMEEWREKLEGMKDLANFHIPQSLLPSPEGETGKRDIADFLLEEAKRESWGQPP